MMDGTEWKQNAYVSKKENEHFIINKCLKNKYKINKKRLGTNLSESKMRASWGMRTNRDGKEG